MIVRLQPVFALAYLACLILVAVLSLIPQPEIDAPEGSDKALHLIAYSVIAACAGLGFTSWNRRFLACAAAIGIGILLEIAQATWAGRNGSVADALANTAGVALGLLAAFLVLRLFGARAQPEQLGHPGIPRRRDVLDPQVEQDRGDKQRGDDHEVPAIGLDRRSSQGICREQVDEQARGNLHEKHAAPDEQVDRRHQPPDISVREERAGMGEDRR